MLAELRLAQIHEDFAAWIDRIAPLVVEDETLQIVLYLTDGTNLRVTEKWRGDTLEWYSYYWLTPENRLKIGWDNARHHSHLENFPHHKHIAHQATIQASAETTLAAVMQVIAEEVAAKKE